MTDGRQAKRAARAELWTRVLILTVVVIAVFGTVLALLIRNSQVHHAPTIDETHTAAVAAQKGTKRIESCTTPGRACYDQGQRRLAQTILGLTSSNQQAAAAAAACAATLPSVTYRAVYRCVIHTVSQKGKP